MEKFDLAIIGSGSGNGIPEELSGWKIALIEESVFGGTCLNKGCIPSKMFVLPGDRVIEAEEAANIGVDQTTNGIDWEGIRDRVFGRIDPISEGGLDYRKSLENITVFEARAEFLGNKHLKLSDGTEIEADKILIGTGARPFIPPIEGLAESRYHTSDTVMRLEQLPESMAIIGGGFIAAEMGHVFSSYGTKVALFNRGDRMLKAQDSDISEAFAAEFGKRVDLKLGTLPTKVADSGDRIELTFADGSTTIFDEVLVAAGRTPNTDNLGLENTDIEVANSIIVVDSQMKTSVDGVFAVGDAANEFQLKHVANAEAKVAFHNIANDGDTKHISYKGVPGAVFSNPQVASVGLTETKATEAGANFVVGRTDYGGTAYGWALEDKTSFCKILVDTDSGLVLGAHIIGPQAATLIQPVIQAISLDLTAEQLARGSYYIHPALTEVVENATLDALSKT